MPHIDKFSVKEKYRAWDSDILSKLKIPDNDQQMDHINENSEKLEANWEQTGSKVEANREQSRSKLGANWEQTVSKVGAVSEKTSPQSVSTTVSKVEANWEQTESKNRFFSLTGLQRQIVIFIHGLCVLERAKKTSAVSIDQISCNCACTIKTAKNAIARLVKKGILLRNGFKNGRSGWTVYSLSDDVHREIMTIETGSKLEANHEQTVSKLATKLATKLEASVLSSSRSNILNKTTTTETTPEKVQLSEEWLNVDIEPLSKINFTRTHLTQIALRFNLSPETVQESIYMFAFDLEVNKKAEQIDKDPIRFFMGILYRSGGYAQPSNYESPRARYVRLYKERKAEEEARDAKIEDEAISLSFKNWFRKVPNAQRVNLLPESLRKKSNLGESMMESAGKTYFIQKIWLEIRERVLSGKDVPEPSYVIDSGEAQKIRTLAFEQDTKARTEEALKVATGRK